MPDGLPPRVGPYEPLELIAEGGMARVVLASRARSPGAEKRAALKLILPELAADPQYLTMFLDEARMASRIRHPNVVAVLDMGCDEATGILYIAMELVLGATLADVIRAHPSQLPVNVALEIIAQAADGLDAAHRAASADGTPLEIVHRDVSPQNLLIGFDGVVRVTDFGVARAAKRSTRTETGKFKGKLGYCSPEHMTGAPIDHRSDIFALGIVAFELLTYVRLFHRSTPSKTLEAVLTSEVPGIGSIRRDIPPGAAAVIDEALRRDVDARPEPASAIAERIRAAVSAAGLESASPGLRAAVRASAGDQAIRLAGFDPRPTPSGSTPIDEPATRADLPRSRDTVVDIGLVESD